jgi:hypothetical protein
MSKRVFILFGACVLSLFLIGCGSTSTNTGTVVTPTPTIATTAITTPTDTPTPTNQHFKVGQVVNVGNIWTVKIVSVKTSPHGEFAKPRHAGDVFLIFQVAVKNISSEEQLLASGEFTLKDTEGQQYDMYYDDEAGPWLGGKVEAGDPLKGSLTYEVPKSVHDFRLSFEVSLYESGQTIWDIHV